jgi:transposase
MRITSSYSAKLTNKEHNRELKFTISYYRKVLAYLIKICDAEYSDWCELSGNAKNNFIEKLIHGTKKNLEPKYADFDTLFFSMPSYYRRSAIQKALGIVLSYRSNLANWENTKRDTKQPKLSVGHFAFPALYRIGSFVQTDKYTVKIKLYNGRAWEWYSFNLRKSDVDYIQHHLSEFVQSAPVLEKQYKSYGLRFAYSTKRELGGNDINQVICAVDLGINNPATCVAMNSNGTILGRKVISLPRETGCLNHQIGYIKKAQKHGNHKMPRLWSLVKGINHDLSAKTAQGIMDFALEHNCETIVFEHLDMSGKKSGKMKQRITLWRHQEVQNIVTLHAHLANMRVSRVCAWNTSALAFDGSGSVIRNLDGRGNVISKDDNKTRKSYSICKFTTGKIYHADLNAAYNIGARFFLRLIEKTISVTKWLAVSAKVSGIANRTRRTLSDLIRVNAELNCYAA